MFVLLAAGAGLVSTGYGLYRYLSSGTPPPPATTDNNSDLVIPPAPPLPPVNVEVQPLPANTEKVSTKTGNVSAKTKEDLLSELKKKLEERREGFELITARAVNPTPKVEEKLIDLDDSSVDFQL